MRLADVQDNRALSADEIAAIAIDEGWLRPPSAAVVPSTVINNAIRAHQKRASIANPPRPSLLNKHQLAGSVNESVLESALHPAAFSGLTRPKGSFWYLAHVAKVKWKNPFAGIEIPKAPPRKPGPPKRTVEKSKPKPIAPQKSKSKSAAAIPPKVRLVIRPNSQNDADDAASEAESSSNGSRDVSRSASLAPVVPATAPIPINRMNTARNASTTIDSSDESDPSDSEPESGPSSRIHRPVKLRRERPAPLPLSMSNSSRITIPPHVSRSLGSPFLDWGSAILPDSPILSSGLLPPPHASPFPSHSLDNTTWGVRHDHDRFASLETSSSSSDDEMRDSVDWGTVSGIMIRSAEEGEGEDVKPVWSAEDEDSKIKEATDALRVLFPMSTTDDDVQLDDRVPFNQLDNRLTPSETSSITESNSTATLGRGPLKSADLASSLALATWNGVSSPVASPRPSTVRMLPREAPDASPTHHLSKLNDSFDASDMDVDEVWPDGELPVRADDTSSDVELDPDMASNVGDMPTPEDDRQLHTAAWAREAAASTSFRVKDEVSDYPSPMTTESDDVSHADYRASRASSQDSNTPSSGLSDLPPYDIDPERLIAREDLETVLDGPESISMEELDGWFPGKGRPDKTPQRNRSNKAKQLKDRTDVSQCSGIWGGIGVGTLGDLSSSVKITPPGAGARSRNNRSAVRRKSSTRTPVITRTVVETLPTPPADNDQPVIKAISCDMDLDAIGPADLEAACAEAEAREERHRKACREKAENQKAFLEAYRQKVKEAQSAGQSTSDITPPEGWDRMSPWSDGAAGAWGSTDSINIQTPSALSPMALHMSALSLDTPMYQSMDPKALISPPLVPAVAAMVEDGLPSIDVAPRIPTPAKSIDRPAIAPAPGPTLVPIAPAPAPSAPSRSASHPTSATERRPVPIAIKKEPAGTAHSDQPKGLVAIAPARPASASDKPATPVPIAQKPSPALKPIAPSVSGNKPKLAAAPAEAVKKPVTPATSGTSTPTSATGTKPRITITKPLCPGVDACVIDSIPVYAHVQENKGVKFTLLRRLDTDFGTCERMILESHADLPVNATTLLSAFGVPVGKHDEYLKVPSPWLAAHHIMGTHCIQSGSQHTPGVPGIWVPFVEAKELVKKLKVAETGLLANFLRADLFQLVSCKPFVARLVLITVCDLGQYQPDAFCIRLVWLACKSRCGF